MGVTRSGGRRRKKLLDDLREGRGYSHLKEEALNRTMWRNRFGGGFGPSLDRLLNDDDIPSTQKESRHQGHSAARMKNLNEIIEDKTHDLKACSAVPQPTAPSHSALMMSKKSRTSQSSPIYLLLTCRGVVIVFQGHRL